MGFSKQVTLNTTKGHGVCIKAGLDVKLGISTYYLWDSR